MNEAHCSKCIHRVVCYLRSMTSMSDAVLPRFCKYWKDEKDCKLVEE